MNKTIKLSVAASLLTVLLLPYSAYASTDRPASTVSVSNHHHLNLPLNLSDGALEMMGHTNVAKGNNKFFKTETFKKGSTGSLDVSFDFSPSSDSGMEHVKGTGNVKVAGFTAPVTLDGDVQLITLTSGKKFYIGPVDANLKIGGQSQTCLVGLTYNPQTGNAFISLTVGAISNDGNGLVFFGTPLPETREILDEKAKLANVDKQPVASSQPVVSPQLISPQLSNASYYYKNSDDNYYMRWQNDSISEYTG